jgi:hypothetical protein
MFARTSHSCPVPNIGIRATLEQLYEVLDATDFRAADLRGITFVDSFGSGRTLTLETLKGVVLSDGRTLWPERVFRARPLSISIRFYPLS